MTQVLPCLMDVRFFLMEEGRAPLTVFPVEFTKRVPINGSMHETSLCSRNLGSPNILTTVLFYCSNNNLYGITNK